MITKNELLELSKVQDATCISIFIPAHRAGQETLEGKDALHLKNQLKEVRKKLEAEHLDEHDIEAFERPIHELLEDSEFWRHQSDGLAVFISEGIFKAYTVPVSFEPLTYISNSFYLLPLISMFNEEGLFYILTINTEEVKFYEGTKYEITEIDIQDLIPSRLEDRVGYDYDQKNVQFKSQKGDKEEATFHGHDDAGDENKKELMVFFRAVDNGLMSILSDTQEPPMIICGLDSHVSIYKEVNSYQNLFPENISVNPADVDLVSLHDEARELLTPYFSKDRKTKKEKFFEVQGTGKSSTRIEEIVPAAVDGKIDTLFVQTGSDIFGIYDPAGRDVIVREKDQTPNVSLLNLIAVKTLDQGGKIYFQSKEDMPDDTSIVNAVFRY